MNKILYQGNEATISYDRLAKQDDMQNIILNIKLNRFLRIRPDFLLSPGMTNKVMITHVIDRLKDFIKELEEIKL